MLFDSVRNKVKSKVYNFELLRLHYLNEERTSFMVGATIQFQVSSEYFKKHVGKNLNRSIDHEVRRWLDHYEISIPSNEELFKAAFHDNAFKGLEILINPNLPKEALGELAYEVGTAGE